MAHHHDRSTENIGTAFWLNFGFTLLEIVGGLWTNSTAILSDAVHDLGDSLSLVMAWLLERRAEKGGEHHVFSAHLVVDAVATRTEATALKQKVRTLLNGHEFMHTAVEIEYAGEWCQLE